jgi:hypothetical protein
MATLLALMRNDKLPFFHYNRHWFHQSPAFRQPITGINVYVFAPQALGTVIGIAIANNLRATLFALKILFISFKSCCHYLSNRCHSVFTPFLLFSAITSSS